MTQGDWGDCEETLCRNSKHLSAVRTAVLTVQRSLIRLSTDSECLGFVVSKAADVKTAVGSQIVPI